ncbi:MAG: hypothetical protein IJG05_09220 [Solobacterium sp.]|nr:hypothetical protein [Solobacterium sp.]
MKKVSLDKKYIFAIDPGNTESGYVLVSAGDLQPILMAKEDNHEVLDVLSGLIEELPANSLELVIEMVASFGMPVGREVFDTCVWIGRFIQCAGDKGLGHASYITRMQEKLAICHNPHANDATIKQALIDRFAYGQKNYGKGTKKDPGWFYGFKADIWSAYAIAVTWSDLYGEKDDQQSSIAWTAG